VLIAYLDCLSGISGDMLLGALIDAGVPLEVLSDGIRGLGLPELDLQVRKVKKYGFAAAHVQVIHPEQKAHRHLHHIHAMIDGATGIADDARRMAKEIFLNLAMAEAKVHGTGVEKVHFHEVGAIDSIADIVGVAIGLRWLGVEIVEASPVPTGTGWIEIAHGRVSIPAPATAELLAGIPLAASDVPAELTTPTGAAILKTIASRFGSIGSMTIQRIGYGAGTRDLAGQANVLRLILGQRDELPPEFPVEVDQVVVLQTNIDSETPEDLADCVARLWQGGAVDIFQSPCVMKKGRVGTELTILGSWSRVAELERILFEYGGTLGIRRMHADRRKLIRKAFDVQTPLGRLRGKCVWLPSGRWRFSVEHEEAKLLAQSSGLSIAEIRQQALALFAENPPPPPQGL